LLSEAVGFPRASQAGPPSDKQNAFKLAVTFVTEPFRHGHSGIAIDPKGHVHVTDYGVIVVFT